MIRPSFRIPTSVIIVLALAAQESRASYTIDLDQRYQGADPGGMTPWVSATFEQADVNTVRLTLTSHLESPSEFVTDWLFNLNPEKNAADLTFSLVSSTLTANPPPMAGNNAFVLDGPSGQFDISFSFGTSNLDPDARFSSDDVVVYDISLTGGLSELDFAVGSEGGTFPIPPISVARIGGIGSESEQGIIRDSSSNLSVVPAPPAIILAAVGLMGFPLLRPWLRRGDCPKPLQLDGTT